MFHLMQYFSVNKEVKQLVIRKNSNCRKVKKLSLNSLLLYNVKFFIEYSNENVDNNSSLFVAHIMRS